MGSVDMELTLDDAANSNGIRLRDSGNGSLKPGAAEPVSKEPGTTQISTLHDLVLPTNLPPKNGYSAVLLFSCSSRETPL